MALMAGTVTEPTTHDCPSDVAATFGTHGRTHFCQSVAGFCGRYCVHSATTYAECAPPACCSRLTTWCTPCPPHRLCQSPLPNLHTALCYFPEQHGSAHHTSGDKVQVARAIEGCLHCPRHPVQVGAASAIRRHTCVKDGAVGKDLGSAGNARKVV